ncbi:sulfatase-like hydrolase/transferase [Opitutales bacterium]|nr:sulfatase-like hydrolase/transferase [Opitutales bacterium]
MNKISKAFGLFFLLGVLGQVVSSTPALPNVVIIYVDDMGYGDLGVQNPDSLIPTPHLDQLAREGMRFTDGHSSSSQCSPSRYALLTGGYHWRHSDTLTSDMGPSAFTKEQLTMPEMFQELGYETAAIGKWHLGFNWLANVKPGVKLKNRKDPDVNAFDWTLKAPDGPTSHGFDYYFGDGTTNKPPFAWVENDHISGEVPNINLTREMSAASNPGPGVKGWDHEKVMPTLLEITGTPMTDQLKQQVEGRSLIPILKNPATDWEDDRHLVHHVGAWEPGQAAQSKHKRVSIQNKRFTLVNNKKGEELFDLKNDPGETKNVINEYPEVVAQLRAVYDKWWINVQPRLVNEDAYKPPVE